MKEILKINILVPVLFMAVSSWMPVAARAAEFIKGNEGGFRPVMTLDEANQKAAARSLTREEVAEAFDEHEDLGRKTYLYPVEGQSA